jgi:lipopolysaccharide transport system permease protein
MNALPDYEVVIAPTGAWTTLFSWRELWDYRDLLALLVRRDYVTRYRQTLLGPLWYVLQPVAMTAVFWLVFGRFLGIPTNGVPAPLFFLSGLVVWNYFAQNVTVGGATFVNNAHVFSKVWFPRLIVPLATVVSNLLTVALQLVPFGIFLAYYKIFTDEAAGLHIGWGILLVPVAIFHAALLSFGISLLVAASTARFRDLIHLNQYVVQLWMFATPVIYPLSRIPERWRWLEWANPLCVPVETMRIALLGRGSLHIGPVLASGAIALALVLTGLAAFQRVERSAMDTV